MILEGKMEIRIKLSKRLDEKIDYIIKARKLERETFLKKMFTEKIDEELKKVLQEKKEKRWESGKTFARNAIDLMEKDINKQK